MTLTADDHVDIRQLLARYGHALDFGDADSFLSCFAPGAHVVIAGVEHSGATGLREYAESVFDGARGHERHGTHAAIIDGDGDQARALSFAWTTLDFGGDPSGRAPTPAGVLESGYFDDAVVRLDGRWVFARRTFLADGSADSLARRGTPLELRPVLAPAGEETDDSGMSALDYEAITQLLARYAYTIDFQDVDGLLGCFTEDGVFDVPGENGEFGFLSRGHDALRVFAGAVGAAGEGLARHASTSILIDGDGQHAVATSYCFNPFTYLYGGETPAALGERYNTVFGKTAVYRDELVKDAGHWRIARRIYGDDGRGFVMAMVSAAQER